MNAILVFRFVGLILFAFVGFLCRGGTCRDDRDLDPGRLSIVLVDWRDFRGGGYALDYRPTLAKLAALRQ